MEGDVSLHLRERTWGALRCRRTIPAPISWRSLYFAFEHLAERRPGRLRGMEAAPGSGSQMMSWHRAPVCAYPIQSDEFDEITGCSRCDTAYHAVFLARVPSQ